MRWTLVAIVAAACGSSAAELRSAKTARYNADPQQILKLAEEAARDSYKIARLDEQAKIFVTQPRFYSAEGDLESPGAEGFVHARGGSVSVAFTVEVVALGDSQYGVTVTPKTYEVVSWSPQPRELAPDDIYLPPFVKGRADALALAIYERAKPYVAAPPGGR